MNYKEFKDKVIKTAEQFGMVTDDGGKKGKNAIVRDTTKKEAADDSAASSGNKADTKGVDYFGFVRPDQGPSGVYNDLSLVFFPTPDRTKTVMCLVVGTGGYQDDAVEASRPGLRRMFRQLLPYKSQHAPFCKVDFLDIANNVTLGEAIKSTGLKLDKYLNVMLIGCLNDFDNDWQLVEAWIAQYATLRKWPTNAEQRKAVEKAKNEILNKRPKVEYEKDVAGLLKYYKFVVLQGAPGSGKTYLAEKIGIEHGYNKVFMTQFHAETTYSDFVEGITPDLDGDTIRYKATSGTLVEAMTYANDNPNEKVLLIIDEINRANLANVLGPVFYLFEKDTQHRAGDGIKLGDKYFNKVPANLHVIATMNTADRSIAVVDFALRRRFAWYTVAPHLFDNTIDKAKDFFNRLQEIFIRHATDEEMNLMPGGSYFTASDENEFAKTVQYGLMPLIREYLDQGLLSGARNDLFDLFYTDYNLYLYE